VETVGDELVVQTPAGGWNEVSALPLLGAGLALIVGLLSFYVGLTRADRSELALGAAATVVGAILGARGIRLALERFTIRVTPTRVEVGRRIGWRAHVHSADISSVTVDLKIGRAWEVGLPPRWYDLQREYSALWLRCGPKAFRVLNGVSTAEKRKVAAMLTAKLEGSRDRSR
jgi:hypothetical protein